MAKTIIEAKWEYDSDSRDLNLIGLSLDGIAVLGVCGQDFRLKDYGLQLMVDVNNKVTQMANKLKKRWMREHK